MTGKSKLFEERHRVTTNCKNVIGRYQKAKASSESMSQKIRRNAADIDAVPGGVSRAISAL